MLTDRQQKNEAKLAARTGGVKVKALEWEETHSRRSDEDPTAEWNGGFEADSALGYYKISMGFGSDAYYWAVTNPLGDDVGSSFEDPLYAKAAAQADYERRILSALSPAPEAKQEAARIGNAVLDWMIKYDLLDGNREYYVDDVLAVLNDLTPSARPAEQAAPEAQQEPVAWLHEIEEPGLEKSWVLSRRKDNPWTHWLETYLSQCEYKATPLYTRPAEQAVTEAQQEPVAWLHEIEESGATIRSMMRRSEDKPWSHWERQQEYKVTPLYAHPAEQAVTEAWPEPKVTNPDIANPTGVPYLDCLIHRLLDAQQDINLAANERMDQSLCDASSLIDEVETCIRRFAATRPSEQAVTGADLEYEVWTTGEDSQLCAMSTSLSDAMHYAKVYGQDGPVEIFEVIRFPIKAAMEAGR